MTDAVQGTDRAALLASLTKNNNNTAGEDGIGATQDRFLTLLVTQMQNQDPLNPMENAQVTTQLAQLSTVTGIDKLNETLASLSQSMMGNQSLQAAGMIGRNVMLEGDQVDLVNGMAMGGMELPQAVDNASVSISDSAGVLVRSLNLGAMREGIQRWQWDGLDSQGETVPDGQYQFKVQAMRAEEDVGAQSLQLGYVSSVTQGKDGVTLEVGATDGIALDQIKQIL